MIGVLHMNIAVTLQLKRFGGSRGDHFKKSCTKEARSGCHNHRILLLLCSKLFMGSNVCRRPVFKVSCFNFADACNHAHYSQHGMLISQV